MRCTALWTLALVTGCGNKGGDSGEELSPDLVFTDANNYGYEASLSLGSTDVAAGASSAVDWCALSVDLRGRPVVPELIDRMVLIEVDATHEEVVAKIEANELTQADTVTQWMFDNAAGGCTADLDAFEIIGNGFDPATDFLETDHSWLLSATYYDAGVFDFAMSQFVVPKTAEPNTAIAVTDGSATLTATADLHTIAPMRTSAGFDAFTLDWSAVTTDVYGAEYDDQRGNRVLIGKVPFDDLADVEAVFLRVDSEAEALYRLNQVDGVPVVQGETSADLMLATDAAGNAFPGFTTDGIWLVGVECATCTSPAPLLLGVVEVEP